jgi:hypothetical protein
MKLRRQLRNLFSSIKNSTPKKHFIYPYADDMLLKREQVWSNLQQGLLLEDKGLLIPWFLPFSAVGGIHEQRRERADRTEWFLGHRTILGGYEANLELVYLKFKPADDPIKRISENLGQDAAGYQKFTYLRNYLTDLLGEPTRADLQKFGEYDMGEISWENGPISILLVGVEHVNLRYTFSVGIKPMTVAE